MLPRLHAVLKLAFDPLHGPVQDGGHVAVRDPKTLGGLPGAEFLLHAQFIHLAVGVREHSDHLPEQPEHLPFLRCGLEVLPRIETSHVL